MAESETASVAWRENFVRTFLERDLSQLELGPSDHQELLGHPKAGASWEGFALEQVLAHVTGRPWFWATHGGAELDLVMLRRKQRWGFEFKMSPAPGLTRSMQVAVSDLELDHLWVIHPGKQRIRLADKVTAVPLGAVMDLDHRKPV